jgi:hypothetical protein
MTSEGKESDAIELTLKANHKSLIAAPNNLKQMTEEEYDAWIQKVTDSIAGRILLRKVDRPEPKSGSRGGEQWN